MPLSFSIGLISTASGKRNGKIRSSFWVALSKIAFPWTGLLMEAFTLKFPAQQKISARATMTKKNMTFPAPVSEIPAANVDKAAAYYVNALGFTLDWGEDEGGIAGISRGNCRLFITNCPSGSPTATWALSFSCSISIARLR